MEKSSLQAELEEATKRKQDKNQEMEALKQSKEEMKMRAQREMELLRKTFFWEGTRRELKDKRTDCQYASEDHQGSREDPEEIGDQEIEDSKGGNHEENHH